MNEKQTLNIERYFTRDGNPYNKIAWQTKNTAVKDEEGKVLFEQAMEAPDFWNDTTRSVVASRYFYGKKGTPEREKSAKDLVNRIAETMSKWSIDKGYLGKEEAEIFKQELQHLTINQMMAFNSPVWFNTGIDRYIKPESRGKENKGGYIVGPDGKAIQLTSQGEYIYPQTSACFIQSVEDNMESIMQLNTNEAMLFKYGSGTGTNNSTIRSSKEQLTGGGTPSGPTSFMKIRDATAGVVKSGGKTRRAAKMEILNVEHPDIREFINLKKDEQKKLEVLMDYGGLTYATAESSVAFQNANVSVRATDAFMWAVLEDKEWQTIPVRNKDMADKMPKYKAKDLMRLIAEGTYYSGDPGMQFHDIINKWHTCPNAEPITASNPCSEYMFVNDSSCNLASHNLMKYVKEDGTLDIDTFSKAVRITTIAQDLEFDNSSFPTAKIAENSHNYRPLGQGYANLGSLAMFLGMPYDSDEFRAISATITALMTGKVYETSTELAEKVGPFNEYQKNKDSVLKVLRMHRDAISTIDKSKLPKEWTSALEESVKTWDNVVKRAEVYGVRNAQATVMAPTGTIAFMMGCDTTGIEPETWVYKVKKTAEGGMITFVNETVPFALKRLGYSDLEIDKIKEYISTEHRIEDAPGLKPEHAPIFDTAYKHQGGKRYISYQGHLKMMAAIQPFLSGAISKTVGLPNDVSVEEIEKVYIESWKSGLKAVALYRDGSKRRQPLSGGLEKKVDAMVKPVRRRLPDERESITHKFSIAGHEGYLTVGLYEDRTPGEIFITMAKEGSTISGTMDSLATATSIALQYNVPLKVLVDKFSHARYEPSGFTNNPNIPIAKSISDYIFRWLGKKFIAEETNGEDNSSLTEDILKPGNNNGSGKSHRNGEAIKTKAMDTGKMSICCGAPTTTEDAHGCKEMCSNCGTIATTGCAG